MSNMTPFEIRLELLRMAKDMLYDDYNAQRDKIQQDWNIKCDTAKAKGETPPEHPALPTIPSETDIINKAQTLNGFVSNIQQPEPAAKVLNKRTS
jgi:hypothetical protein